MKYPSSIIVKQYPKITEKTTDETSSQNWPPETQSCMQEEWAIKRILSMTHKDNESLCCQRIIDTINTMQDTWVVFDNLFSTTDSSSLFIRRLGDNNTYGSIYDHLFNKKKTMLPGQQG